MFHKTQKKNLNGIGCYFVILVQQLVKTITGVTMGCSGLYCLPIKTEMLPWAVVVFIAYPSKLRCYHGL